MMPFAIRSGNAGWKLLILTAAVLISMLMATLKVNAQPVAMVKHQPFPFASGVALDTITYDAVKQKLRAADRLRISSKRAVDSLQAEVKATRKALDDQFLLGKHDAGTVMGLTAKLNLLQADLVTAQNSLRAAEDAIGNVLAQLPRRIRKNLRIDQPDAIARAASDYLATLKMRKWTWSGSTLVVGIGIGIFLVF